MKEQLIKELEFCLELWGKQGHCEFGNHTKCEECAAPYLLLKLINGEVLHGKMKRLTLTGWKDKLAQIGINYKKDNLNYQKDNKGQ